MKWLVEPSISPDNPLYCSWVLGAGTIVGTCLATGKLCDGFRLLDCDWCAVYIYANEF